VKVFGIDPGSDRTGYGCVDSDGRRHRLVRCGAVQAGTGAPFAERLGAIYRTLIVELDRCRPDCVAIENLFYATNVRSALKLGHARGVAMLAAVECGLPVHEGEALGQDNLLRQAQNAVQQAQWEKLGFTPDTAASLITSRFDYSFNTVELAITAVVIIGYFVLLFIFSKTEYRDVIEERFGKK